MYQHFYGLCELPFELTPDPKYLFLTRQHREALSTLEYGLSSGKGVTLLIGEAGTGKTTLIRAALESERCRNVSCVYLVNPTLTRQEFVEALSLRFGLSTHAGASKAALLEELVSVARDESKNILPVTIELVRAGASMGDIIERLKKLWGTYRENPVF